jgi:hypothetical protein
LTAQHFDRIMMPAPVKEIPCAATSSKTTENVAWAGFLAC